MLLSNHERREVSKCVAGCGRLVRSGFGSLDDNPDGQRPKPNSLTRTAAPTTKHNRRHAGKRLACPSRVIPTRWARCRVFRMVFFRSTDPVMLALIGPSKSLRLVPTSCFQPYLLLSPQCILPKTRAEPYAAAPPSWHPHQRRSLTHPQVFVRSPG